MKILIVHQHLILGGVEKVLVDYANNLHLEGHQIELVISFDLGEDNFFAEQLLPGIKISYVFDAAYVENRRKRILSRKENIFKKLLWEFSKLQEQITYGIYLRKKLQSEYYDLLIDFHESLDKFIRFPLLGLKLPAAIRWVHGQLGGGAGLSFKLHRKYEKIFSKYQGIICICDQMAEQLSQQFPMLPKKRFYTLYNFVELEKLQEKSKEEIKHNIVHPYILQVSRLVEGKGHEELLDIYVILKQRGLNHKLYFVGDGSNRSRLEEKIAKLGLKEDCFLLGASQNPYPYFKQADLFVHTSEHEGLSMVLLESMACGTPVVAMDCLTGPRDILGSNNEYGRLIPMYDKKAFADAVYELLNNEELYHYYVEKSNQRIQDFSMQKVIGALNKILLDVKN